MSPLYEVRNFKFHCPACRRIYARSLTPVQLGTGRRRCMGCGNTFRDGSQEWPQLGGWERFQYLFPIMIPVWIATVVGAVILYWAPWPDSIRGRELYVAQFLAAVVVPWVPFYLWRAHLISKSVERFERQRVFGDTDESILSA